MISTNNCVDALSATIKVIDDTGKQLMMKVTSEIHKELLGEDVLPLHEQSLDRKLLLIENFEYDAKFVVLNIDHGQKHKQPKQTSL